MPAAQRMTRAQLITLAREVVTNQVFMCNDPRIVTMSFMVLGFVKDWREGDLKTIGAVYERYDKAAPRMINGYPIFFSCKFVHVNDLSFILGHIARMDAALKAGTE